jgi:hypothetical protein
MNSHNIINALYYFFNKKNCSYFSCNTNALDFESDFLAVNKSDFVFECEIKISRSDFFADFKKEQKHKLLSEGKHKANYFFYAVPSGLILPSDVPPYAGLIYIDKVGNRYRVTIMKDAPRMHKEKLSQDVLIKILRSMMYKYFNHKTYIENEKN